MKIGSKEAEDIGVGGEDDGEGTIAELEELVNSLAGVVKSNPEVAGKGPPMWRFPL